jgi:pimeloyl-ACP methyl ester carboxylesterase
MRPVILIHMLLLGLCGCADRFLLFPSTQPIDAPGAERFALPCGAEVWIARSATAREHDQVDAYVLEFTGNATRAEQITTYVADRWAPHRVEVWVMNYPGFGGSKGRATLGAISPVALATYDELQLRAGDKPIFVCGNSLGSAVALSVCARRDASGMVLQNPPAIRSIILGEHGWWNLWLAAGVIALGVPGDLDAISNASKISIPAVVITADDDTLVPAKYQDRILAKYRGEVRRIILKDKGHNSAIDRPEEIEKLEQGIDWLMRGAHKGAR